MATVAGYERAGRGCQVAPGSASAIWPSADSFVAVALRAGLTLLRGRSRNELAGADLVIAPSMGESGWMRPVKIPSFFKAGLEALDEALPEMRRLLAGAATAKAKSA